MNEEIHIFTNQKLCFKHSFGGSTHYYSLLCGYRAKITHLNQSDSLKYDVGYQFYGLA